eukprot:scaffold142770_cov133-Phaeocystis_antarctica.AAC.1
MPAKNESQKKRHSAASRSARSLTCGTRNGGGSGVWRQDTMDRKGDWLWQRQRWWAPGGRICGTGSRWGSREGRACARGGRTSSAD